ncbi:hypothetical protein GGF37_005008 [Kickxella alabastrina]|nr:hypothetical protein GGF37_005008 [Kickxella alabastrina]
MFFNALTTSRSLIVALVTVPTILAAPIQPKISPHLGQRSPAQQPSTADPLSAWIGRMYFGLNNLRVTSITDTPLRLRSALNAIAQSQADALCAGNEVDADLVPILGDQGISAEYAELVVARGRDEAEDAVEEWAVAKPGNHSPFSAIVYQGYVYVGVGTCNGNWVVALTSEFM